MRIFVETPVDHTSLFCGEIYSSNEAYPQGIAYLRKHTDLMDSDALVVLREFSRPSSEGSSNE
jgi:hypothetical protein